MTLSFSCLWGFGVLHATVLLAVSRLEVCGVVLQSLWTTVLGTVSAAHPGPGSEPAPATAASAACRGDGGRNSCPGRLNSVTYSSVLSPQPWLVPWRRAGAPWPPAEARGSCMQLLFVVFLLPVPPRPDATRGRGRRPSGHPWGCLHGALRLGTLCAEAAVQMPGGFARMPGRLGRMGSVTALPSP